MHKTCTNTRQRKCQQYGRVVGTNFYPQIRNYWQLRWWKENHFYLKVWPLEGQPYSLEWPHTQEYMNSSNCTCRLEKRKGHRVSLVRRGGETYEKFWIWSKYSVWNPHRTKIFLKVAFKCYNFFPCTFSVLMTSKYSAEETQ